MIFTLYERFLLSSKQILYLYIYNIYIYNILIQATFVGWLKKRDTGALDRKRPHLRHYQTYFVPKGPNKPH